MLTSEVSVRCTGRLLAIPSSRDRCSALKGPLKAHVSPDSIERAFLVSHSEQSIAYIFECRSRTALHHQATRYRNRVALLTPIIRVAERVGFEALNAEPCSALHGLVRTR